MSSEHELSPHISKYCLTLLCFVSHFDFKSFTSIHEHFFDGVVCLWRCNCRLRHCILCWFDLMQFFNWNRFYFESSIVDFITEYLFVIKCMWNVINTYWKCENVISISPDASTWQISDTPIRLPSASLLSALWVIFTSPKPERLLRVDPNRLSLAYNVLYSLL